MKNIVPLIIIIFILSNCDSSLNRNHSRCDRKETREITNVYYSKYAPREPFTKYSSIVMNLEFNSYYVNNFSLLKPSKQIALSPVFDPCFEGYSNEIVSISIRSQMDFDSLHPAGTELNSLFISQYSRLDLSKFSLENQGYEYGQVSTIFNFYTKFSPMQDSIHTLLITTKLADQQLFYDTLQQVNMNNIVHYNFY